MYDNDDDEEESNTTCYMNARLGRQRLCAGENVDSIHFLVGLTVFSLRPFLISFRSEQ